MVGGRIGKDGIHGATFSSQALSAASPTSAVQIGDPFTQKKMSDFLIEARDLGLFKGITDNGAGGLSSSLGEMSVKSGGVRIDLDRCPLKYAGLAPWEILVSESQERMSLAVSRDKIQALLDLAARREVEATVVGEFTDSDHVEIHALGRPVGRLSCKFLHEGLPTGVLAASWNPPGQHRVALPPQRDAAQDFLLLLKDPNIASKEDLVRQYDHEVQALSVVGPFVGSSEDGPSDGAVLRPRPDSYRGVTVTHGICPRFGDFDAYRMALCAVDEAFRAHISCGGDPDYAAALDNFSWPDPLPSESNPDASHKLAQLVRACKGLRDACLAYGLPLISGKDSMKNDALLAGRKISVRPTLLISVMGIIPDIRRAMTTDFKAAGHRLFLLGETTGELGGSAYERLTGGNLGACSTAYPSEAMKLYRVIFEAIQKGLIASCHDLAEGGLATALSESSLGGRYGAEVDLGALPGGDVSTLSLEQLLFSETPSRLLISCSDEKTPELESMLKGLPAAPVGWTTDSPRIVLHHRGEKVVSAGLKDVEAAWKEPILA
jgi:phosphoribosylformylglycinamidine synthase